LPTILERVTKVTAGRLGAKEEAITPSSSFTDDLGADSLDLVELIMGLEEEFTTGDKPVKIPDDDAAKIKTVQDAVDYLKAKGITDSDVKPAQAASPETASASPKKTVPAAGKTAPKTPKGK
jgi:acyl carrier protein